MVMKFIQIQTAALPANIDSKLYSNKEQLLLHQTAAIIDLCLIWLSFDDRFNCICQIHIEISQCN